MRASWGGGRVWRGRGSSCPSAHPGVYHWGARAELQAPQCNGDSCPLSTDQNQSRRRGNTGESRVGSSPSQRERAGEGKSPGWGVAGDLAGGERQKSWLLGSWGAGELGEGVTVGQQHWSGRGFGAVAWVGVLQEGSGGVRPGRLGAWTLWAAGRGARALAGSGSTGARGQLPSPPLGGSTALPSPIGIGDALVSLPSNIFMVFPSQSPPGPALSSHCPGGGAGGLRD